MDTRSLPVALTDPEVRLRGEQLADLMAERADTEQRKKDAQDAFKAELAGLDARGAKLAREIRSRSEDREVEVEERRNWTARTMDLYRTDTGELIDSRPMTVSELQIPLPPGGDTN